MAVVTHIGQVLTTAFGAGWHARLQGPIVNLVDRVLEAHREPVIDANAALGAFYRSVEILRVGAAVTPLAAPGASILVTDLLPPA